MMRDRGKLMPKFAWYTRYCAVQTESAEAELRRFRQRNAELATALEPFDHLEGDQWFDAADAVILSMMSQWRLEDRARKRKNPSRTIERGEGPQA